MSEALLEELWRGATDGSFQPGEVDVSLAEGQRLQVALQQRWHEEGCTVGGWKLGMTSGASRDVFGAGVRPFGFILQERIFTSGSTLTCSTIGKAGIENELCFTIGADLGADASRDDAIAAVKSVAPAFEINQRRISGPTSPGMRIADNLSNWGLVTGTSIPVPEDLTGFTVVLSNTDATEGTEEIDRVTALGHIDDHFSSIAKLARVLAEHGLSLRVGDRVITGAFTRTTLTPGRYTGSFGSPIGDVSVVVQP
ncbi:MAG: hypothetical protein O7F71_09920 [Gammaproteobacteria bacterium]|nr:hypothetical protein [Gammaproteobacteria bacterium]